MKKVEKIKKKDKKKKIIVVRFDEDDVKNLMKKANELNVSLSDVIRISAKRGLSLIN